MAKLKFKLIFFIVVSVFFTSCSINKTYEETMNMPDVKVNKDSSSNEVVFNDEEFEEKVEQLPTSGERSKSTLQTNKDGSEVSMMQDGYGNTVETRYFFNHPNLTTITVKTFANGEKEGLAYGHNGERKKLSPQAINIAFSAQGNEIASTIGLTSTKINSTGKVVMPITVPEQNYSNPQPVVVQQPTIARQETVSNDSIPKKEELPQQQENNQ